MSSLKPAAPYSISYDERDHFMSARVTGAQDTVPTSLAYWKEIGEEARRRGVTRVLVLEAFETKASLMDVFQVAEQIPDLIRGLIVAFVDERFDKLEENRFGEDVAVNRGAVGKVFASEDAAAAWLREQ